MPTVLSVLSRSLRLCGVLEGGEVPDATMSEDALGVYNSLLDYWNTQELLVYAIVRQVYPHLAGTASYSLGPGATWNSGLGAPRPPKIANALLLDTAADPDFETPYHPLTDLEYQNVVVKGLQGTWPLGFHYNPTLPAGTVTLWPVPSVAGSTVLYLWQLLTAASAVTDTVTFAPGYQAMVEYNLAEWLAPEYGAVLADQVVYMARETIARVKALNQQTPLLVTDVPSAEGYGTADSVEITMGGF